MNEKNSCFNAFEIKMRNARQKWDMRAKLPQQQQQQQQQQK